MTLEEIRSEMPKLQGKISILLKRQEGYTKDLVDISDEMKDVEILMADDKATIERCDAFINAHKASKNPEIKARVQASEAEKKKAEISFAANKKKMEELQESKEEIENHPENVQISKEVQEAKNKLNEICEVLQQNPTINDRLQEAIRYEYYVEIKKQQDEKGKYEKLNGEFGKSLKDSSNNGLKKLIDEIRTSKQEMYASIDDMSVDSNAAKKRYDDAKKALRNEIKNKYGIEASLEDITYILDYSDGKIEDEFSLPSAESKIAHFDKIITKLEESRDARLAELESKKVQPAPASPESQEEIEQNEKKIEELNNESVAITPQIDELTAQIEELDQKIAEAGDEEEPSQPENSEELAKIEAELKKQHIISDEVVTDLKNEDSEISKLFKQFTEADLNLRRAIAECELDPSEEAMDKLQDKIVKYKEIAEFLQGKSGYDIKSWQYYLREGINQKLEDKESVDSIYFRPLNRDLYKLKGDRDIAGYADAEETYYEVEETVRDIDEDMDAILFGDFEKAQTIKDDFTNYHQGLTDLDAYVEDTSVYKLLKKPDLIEVKPWHKFKNFVARNFSKLVSGYKEFTTPFNDNKKEVKRLLKDYKKASQENDPFRDDSDGEPSLKSQRDALVAQRQALEDKRNQNGQEVENLQERNKKLVNEQTAGTSELGSKEELSFVTREGVEAKTYVAGSGVKKEIEDIVKDDDDGR